MRSRALAREREARALFDISFALAERDATRRTRSLRSRDGPRRDTRCRASGSSSGRPSSPTPHRDPDPPSAPAVHVVLRRRPGDEPAEWVRVHAPGRAQARGGDREEVAYRVVIAAGRPQVRVAVGAPAAGARRPGAGRDAGPRRRGRPARRVARARAADPRRDVGRGVAAERRAEVRPARLGLARPADAAGVDPGGRRDPHGPRDRVAGRPASGDRGVDRSRGRVAQPPRHEPARHEPDRGRRAQAEPRSSSTVARRRRPRRSHGRGPGGRGGPTSTVDVPTRPARRSSSTRCSSARSSQHRSTTPRSTPVRRRRSRSPPASAGEDRVRDHDRGRRAGRPDRGAAAPVREVLPRAAQGRGLAAGDGDRPGGRARARRGDGRPA